MDNVKLPTTSPKSKVIALLYRANNNATDTRSKRSLINEALDLIKKHWDG